MLKWNIFFITFVLFFYEKSHSSGINNNFFIFPFNSNSNWILSAIDSNSYFLSDSSKSYSSLIYIDRFDNDTQEVLTDDLKAQLYFICNLEVAKNLGKVQFYDTSSSLRQGDMRSYELFAFYKIDDEGNPVWWAEYCRWCARDGFVFQITVLGDTLDISKNLDYYSSIVDSIRFKPLLTGSITNLLKRVPHIQRKYDYRIFNLSGQIVGKFRNGNHFTSSGIFLIFDTDGMRKLVETEMSRQ